jgi:sirohydrochlorin cobaltochelatase
MSITASTLISASEPVTRQRPGALVLCAHGARGVACAAEHQAGAMRRAGLFEETDACALYGKPRLETVLDRLSGRDVVLVPFLLAEGWTLDVLIERLRTYRGRVRLAPPLGAHDGMAGVLIERALSGCRMRDWPAAETAVLLVGHGSTRHTRSAATTWRHAAGIDRSGRFAQVAAAFLDQTPTVAEAVKKITAPRIATIGYFSDAGNHGAVDVPHLLRRTGRAAAYLGTIGRDPGLLRLIAEQAKAARSAC